MLLGGGFILIVWGVIIGEFGMFMVFGIRLIIISIVFFFVVMIVDVSCV